MAHFADFDLIILFFLLGILASWFRSDLAMPESVAKFLSIFLLLSLGLKGGREVRIAEDLAGFAPLLSIGLLFCVLIPIALYYLTRKKLGVADAAAVSASYGSVSAVTFITAQSILDNLNISTSGFMVAVMALMEMPAILIAIYFYQKFSQATKSEKNTTARSWISIFSMKSVVLLIGGFVIGFVMNDKSWAGIAPVVQGNFKGFLAFFLLDLGILAQKQLRQAWKFKAVATGIAVIFPLLAGSLAMLVCSFFNLPAGDKILLAVLVGSASYIAAPATVRSTMPEANPALYLALPLALTFPMNLIFGISFYIQLASF